MNEADALDLFQAAIWTVLIAAGPAVIAAMVVGLVIALIQALTQVQEATLTFVPKIVAVLVTIGISAPFVGSQISILTKFAQASPCSSRCELGGLRCSPPLMKRRNRNGATTCTTPSESRSQHA